MATTEIPREFQDLLCTYLPFADTAAIEESSDLAALGLDSMGTVQLLADIEAQYDVELPDELLSEATFATVGSLWHSLAPIVGAADPEPC